VESCEARPTAEAAAGFSNPPALMLSFSLLETYGNTLTVKKERHQNHPKSSNTHNIEVISRQHFR
jgi:hypothetical protein